MAWRRIFVTTTTSEDVDVSNRNERPELNVKVRDVRLCCACVYAVFASMHLLCTCVYAVLVSMLHVCLCCVCVYAVFASMMYMCL